MKREWGDTTTRILALLSEVGPMTRSEVSRHLGMPRNDCASVLSRLCKPTKRPVGPRRTHISGWVYDEEGQRQYPRAVYCLGDQPDVRKPKASRKVTLQRYREATKFKVASVFDLGLTRQQRREKRIGL
jgi:hypothetical protein